jgi:hypothetical protein
VVPVLVGWDGAVTTGLVGDFGPVEVGVVAGGGDVVVFGGVVVAGFGGVVAAGCATGSEGGGVVVGAAPAGSPVAGSLG